MLRGGLAYSPAQIAAKAKATRGFLLHRAAGGKWYDCLAQIL
jgi:hypothetical protein